MPSLQQVQAHNNELMRMEAQRSALEQQRSAAQAQQQYGIQSALSAQSASQQAALAAHGADIEGRLQQVKLNQEEGMRLQRMQHARASIEDNADLSPAEQHMLITQLESGINPLENRQREAGILEQHVRTQAMFQQSQQQGQLFNQQQEWLARGVTGNLQVINDPITGQPGLFHVGPDGKIQQLDFGHQAEMRQAQMQHLQAQTEATQQATQQSGELQPGRVEAQGIGNQTAAAQLQYMRQIHPLQIEHAQAANQVLAQQIAQNPAAFQLQQLQGYAHLGNLQQQLHQRLAEEPYNVGLAQANSAVAQMNMMSHPNDTRLRQAAQAAGIAHTQAQTLHTNAIVDQMPSVLESRQAGTEHAQLTNAIARETLTRLQRGGLPDHIAAQVVDHAIGGVNREIAAADHTAATAPTQRQRDAARQHAEQLRARRAEEIAHRADQAESLIRSTLGMPAANHTRPDVVPAPAPARPVGVQGVRDDMDQIFGPLRR